MHFGVSENPGRYDNLDYDNDNELGALARELPSLRLPGRQCVAVVLHRGEDRRRDPLLVGALGEQ